MGQQEVYDFLKKQIRPLSAKEISEMSGMRPQNVEVACRKLVKGDDVFVKKNSKGINEYMYVDVSNRLTS